MQRRGGARDGAPATMLVALVGLLFLVLVAADDRLTASTELLQALEDANVFTAKVAIGETAYGGIGVFAAEDIAAGSVIMRLPSSLMVNSGGIPASLPLALLREQRNASSEIMRYYLDSLPADCPDNLAASLNVNADHALVSASLRAWKADLLERELQVLRDDDADWTDDELLWSTCMKLSRAFSGVGTGPVMIPFVDLLNHDAASPTCAEQGRWVDEASGEWAAEVTAYRDISAGEELTYPYSESPSKARLLTSFGFVHGAPAASLGAAELPEGDAKWLARHGCLHPARTDLFLEEGSGELTQAGAREAVRCIRLRLYTREEAEWALNKGHLDAPWGGPLDALDVAALRNSADGWRVGNLLSSILQKDHRVTSNTAALCRAAASDEQRAGQKRHLAAATPALRDAIAEESAALAACAEEFGRASEQVMRRGQELFGGDDDDE